MAGHAARTTVWSRSVICCSDFWGFGRWDDRPWPGARTGHAVAAGGLAHGSRGVLQVPSNHVDVGSAALLLTAIARAEVASRFFAVLAGVATGLFLGSKADGAHRRFAVAACPIGSWPAGRASRGMVAGA